MTDVSRTTEPHTAADLSTVQLIDRLTTQVSTLVRTEISSGLDEIKAKGTRVGIGAGVSGAGVVLLLFGLGTLIATAVLGLSNAVPAWLASLIVALVVLVLGAILAAVGAKRAKNALPPVPENTVASVADDIDTIKGGIK